MIGIDRLAMVAMLGVVAAGCGSGSGAASTVTVTRTTTTTTTAAAAAPTCPALMRAVNHLALAVARSNTSGTRLLVLNGIVKPSEYRTAQQVERKLAHAYGPCS